MHNEIILFDLNPKICLNFKSAINVGLYNVQFVYILTLNLLENTHNKRLGVIIAPNFSFGGFLRLIHRHNLKFRALNTGTP